jgi:choline-sulfatase
MVGRANVVLLTVDCFRYDRCGFTGHPKETTPFMDSLAAESTVFDAAFTTGPYTPQSFPGMLAGLHSRSLTYRGDLVCKAIPPDSPTIASAFREAGYSTFATVTNTHLTAARNFDAGFDRFENLRLGDSVAMSERRDTADLSVGTVYRRIWSQVRNRMRDRDRYPNAFIPLVVAYRLAMLRDWPTIDGRQVVDTFGRRLPNDDDGPFFGWLHLMDLHAPLHPGRTREADASRPGRVLHQFMADGARVCQLAHPRYIEMYDAALEYVDRQVESVVDTLREHDLWDDTILIVTGDHGELLGERGRYGHPHHAMVDDLLRVPLIVRVPERRARRLGHTFSLAWLHELLTEVTGIQSSPLPASTTRDSHIEADVSDAIAVSDSVNRDGYSIAVRHADRKFVDHDLNTEPPLIDADSKLFRLRRDPGEHNPIVDARPSPDVGDVVDEYWTDPTDVSELHSGLAADAERRLQQLGYID